jgi:polyisoprenoid-binding protein YceI
MSKTVKIVLGVVVVGVVAVGGFLWWYLKDDAPAKVSLDTAAGQVTTTTGASGETSSVTSVDGTWVVDTTTGTFDYESATGTFAGFRIEEELTGIGSTTAVGRTGDVSGSITLAGDQLTAATFEVDTTTIKTDRSQRDSRVQSALATSQFPAATFTLTQPLSLGADPASGQEVSGTAVGDFTLHGVTKQVEVPIQAKLVGDTVVVVASFDISLADYEVTKPSAPIVASISDTGTVEMQLLLKKQA